MWTGYNPLLSLECNNNHLIINIYNSKAYNVFQFCIFQRCLKLRGPCSYVNLKTYTLREVFDLDTVSYFVVL